jgi:hypothetical protein
MKTHSQTQQNRGFALVVTLSLMILLTIIAVGLLGLSSISLRSSSQTADLTAARANARMALMMATGQLQQHTGQDTRVTARADLLDKNAQPLLGAWKSWEGNDHETQGDFEGRPIAPDYGDKTQSGGKGRFLSWLVSGDPDSLTDAKSPPSAEKTPSTVTLVGENSVGTRNTAQRQVHLVPVPANTEKAKGSIAWWIGGENQKAHIPKPPTSPPETEADWANNLKSASFADPEPFELDFLLGEPEIAANITSSKQVDLITTDNEPAQRKSVEFFHDLTTTSRGLLTNTATGGWRKDLSLFTEFYDDLPNSGLPLFRITPDRDNSCSIPGGSSSNAHAAKSILYPWSAYRGSLGDIPIYQHGAAASWENLKDYTMLYRENKNFQLNQRGIPYAATGAQNSYSFLHKVRLLPVVARVQWIFSYSASIQSPSGSSPTPPPPPGSLYPRLLITPVITLWNPYSVTLTTSADIQFTIPKPLPCLLQYSFNNIPLAGYRSITSGSESNPANPLSNIAILKYKINGSTTSLGPGETRLYSAEESSLTLLSKDPLLLTPGFKRRGGHYVNILSNTGMPLPLPEATLMGVTAKFDNTYNDGAKGVGIYLDMSIGDRAYTAYRMVYKPEVASKTYGKLENLAQSSLKEAISTTPAFMSTMFGARMASNTHIPAKGFLQTSPMVNYTALGGKDVLERTIRRHYGGTNHPVNSPFDYSFVAHSSGGDSYTPNAGNKKGFIISGFTSGDGLSRCIAAEIPSRPLASLGELQHWDLRYENPIPPFCFNIIGNSDATPLLPSNAVVNDADNNLNTNLQHDDAYCANHLLFDDWFFSSIAGGKPSGFGPGDIKRNYAGFVTGNTPLINSAYRPIAQDSAIASKGKSEAEGLYERHVDAPETWRNIASRIEVEGMFNVNSTSVTAWRALLGHARDQEIPYTDAGGQPALSKKEDYAFSRSTIAGDKMAGGGGSLSGGFSGASQIAGFRKLDDSILDAMAEEIVEQVRARGPFLSLSEFVNRQLSSGEPALAGTIQAALNKLESNSSTNFYEKITSNIQGSKRFADGSPPDAANAEYRFPLAARGASVYGVPGWTRQADILRPLAPILSARDDTFTIRAYGDARDRSGKKILATAVCEAIVQRSRDYCDPSESADKLGPVEKSINKTLGRKYVIRSFRWLSPQEI